MAKDNGSKGNPAAKRMGNPNHKAVRGASWARGEKRKQKRREAQQARELANREFVKQAPGFLPALIPGRRPSKQARFVRRAIIRAAGAKTWNEVA